MNNQRWIEGTGLWALAAGALVMSASALATAPSAAMLASTCAGCHGTQGASAGPAMPSLAGQSKEAIVEAMKKFSSGERPSTIMGRLAKGYTDADFAAMGDFFSRQPIHLTQQTLDPGRVARGTRLHQSHCSACHEAGGKQGTRDTPAMAGQWLPYLQMQMALFLEGQRKMPQAMAAKVAPLSVEDLESLLHFYASVK